MSKSSTDVQSEDLIVDIVALLSTLHEKECLRELERRLGVAVDEEAARDEHENAIAGRGLIVSCCVRRVVGQVWKPAELLPDLLYSHELFAFVGQHAFVSVEFRKRVPVRRQGCVVVRDKLGADVLERCHI